MQDLKQTQAAKNGAATQPAFKIVVTGDVMTEWRLAQSKVRNPAQHAALFDSANHMGPYVKAIGAASIAEILVRMLAGLPNVLVGEPRPKVLSPTGWGLELRTEDRYWGSYVVCAQFPKKRGNDDDVVWRIKQKLGVDRNDPLEALANLSPADDGDASLVVVNQSIGDDTRGFMAHWTAWPESLRNPRPDAWLLIEWSRPRLAPDTPFWKFVSGPERFGGRIVVVVTVEDLRVAGLRISRGLSWERTVTQLFEKVKQLWTCDDAPRNGPLCGCAHLVVSFGTSGAVIFSKTNGIVTAKLVYDPHYVEGAWAEQYEGTMSGFTRCLTAGIALEMIRARGNLTCLEPIGAKAGIIAARRVLEVGFIPIGRRGLGDTELPKDLRFPSSLIARVLRSIVAEAKVADQVEKIAEKLRVAFDERATLIDEASFKSRVFTTLSGIEFDTDALTDELERIYDDWVESEANPAAYLQALEDEDDVDDFEKWKRLVEQRLVDRTLLFISPDREAIAAAGKLEVASVDERTAFDTWSILDSVLSKDYEDTPAAARVLEECDKVVQYGEDAIRFPFPTTRFGDLFVTNRVELESLTAVRELMVNYVQSNMPTPLSIAVFGPPGSGKSFGIKQLAKGIAGGRYSRIETRTFNLSQFNGPEALAVALQQVRDDGLSGKMPLVFWDEFDTKHDGGMGWLRYFLAPMQDGKYQDGSAVYYVGRAIFVFAGGTHATMAEFIRKAKVDEHEAERYSPTAIAEKVPDFVSRLKGFVDVPTLDYSVEKFGQNERIVIDAATALRRAYLLRSFLEDSAGDLEETVPHKQDSALQPVLRKRLNVDPGVVAAFLRVKSFRFGARSMEAIVKMSALSGKIRYDRSSLPPDNQLNLHVNAEAFVDFAKREWPG
jgi:hypothetical protein